MLDVVKQALRISTSNTAFDTEVQDLIDGARLDLQQSGVSSEKTNNDSDALIKRAIKTYCKANFGYDNPEADRFQHSYDMLKQHLSLASDYNGLLITFSVTDGTNPIEDALITFNGLQKYTNSSGEAEFNGIEEKQNMEYSVSHDGFETNTGTVDVESSKTVTVTMK